MCTWYTAPCQLVHGSVCPESVTSTACTRTSLKRSIAARTHSLSYVCLLCFLMRKESGEQERHKRMVELNVIEQCLNLFKTSTLSAPLLMLLQSERQRTWPEWLQVTSSVDGDTQQVDQTSFHVASQNPGILVFHHVHPLVLWNQNKGALPRIHAMVFSPADGILRRLTRGGG